MSLPEFFSHPLWSRLAAMHLHFLWQGLLIAWLYWTLVKLFAIESARRRYLLGLMGLAAMMVSTAATLFVVEVPQSEKELAIAEAPQQKCAEQDRLATVPLTLTLTLSPEGRGDKREKTLNISHEGRGVTKEKALTRSRGERVHARMIAITNTSPPDPRSMESQSPLISVLLTGWFLGVMILGLRLLGGVGTVVWWRWSSLPIRDPRWQSTLEALSHRLGMRNAPRLAVSLRAQDAFSLGLVRPLIIVPAAWLLKLPPAMFESILAHELAHIRRWDAWANLFQRILEAWLFYHPAVWWLSRQVEKEREKCCDLWAVSLTGDRLLYVKTLAEVAELRLANGPARLNGPILATGMGGKNMVLLERVRHILGETPRTGAASRFLAGALVLAIPAALWAGTAMLPAVAADNEDNLIAQADDGDEDGNRRRDGDAPKKGPRDGEQPRGDGPRDGEEPRGDGPRDGEQPRGDGPRDGDRPRGDGERDGDRPRGDGPRDGDRPRGEGERDGDRPRGEGERDGDLDAPEGRRDGDRPEREGDRPNPFRRRVPGFPPGPLIDGPGPGRLPAAPAGDLRPGRPIELDGPAQLPGVKGRGFPRPGERGRKPDPQAEVLQLIRELRTEVEQLRREVRELKEAQGGRGESEIPRIRREERRVIRRPEGERRDGEARDREREDERRDGEARETEREDEPRDGEARNREREDEPREGEAREREREDERPDGEAAERETDEDRERLEKAREERDREAEGDEVVKLMKPSTPEALFVFAALDKNKDNQIDREEWAASKSTREAFESQKIPVSLPANSPAFLALYPDQRLFPQLRLPGQ